MSEKLGSPPPPPAESLTIPSVESVSSPESGERSHRGFSKVLGAAFEAVVFPHGADNEEYKKGGYNDQIKGLAEKIKSDQPLSEEDSQRVDTALAARLGCLDSTDGRGMPLFTSLVEKTMAATEAVNSLASGSSEYTGDDVLSLAKDSSAGPSLVYNIYSSMKEEYSPVVEWPEPAMLPEVVLTGNNKNKLSNRNKLPILKRIGKAACLLLIATGSIIGVAKSALFDSDSEPVKNPNQPVQVDEFSADKVDSVQGEASTKADEKTKGEIADEAAIDSGNIEELNKDYLASQTPTVNVVGDSVLSQSEVDVREAIEENGMIPGEIEGIPGSSIIDHVEYNGDVASRVKGNKAIEDMIEKGDDKINDQLVIASGTNEQSLIEGDKAPTGYGEKIDPSVIAKAREDIVDKAIDAGYDEVIFTNSAGHRPEAASIINNQLTDLANKNSKVKIAEVGDIWKGHPEYFGGESGNLALDGVHFNNGETGQAGKDVFADRIASAASASEFLFNRPDMYDYASSRLIMPNGEERIYWGTGGGELKDRIVYSVKEKGEDKWSDPIVALEPGANDWSLTHVNDPSVIYDEAGYAYKGDKYPFMMHYTTTSGDNTGNVIGVAYSKDGVKWEQYDKPVIKPLNEGHIAHDGKLSYGVGQTSALKLPDGRTLVMYTDLTRERADGYDGRIVISSTTDGINFKELGEVSTDGAPAVWNNDFAISPDGKFITAAMPLGDWTDKDEVGSFGIFKMPTEDFLNGKGHWQKMGEINKEVTGNVGNHSPDITTLADGAMPSSGEIEVTYASGTGGPFEWDIKSNELKTGK